MHALALKDKEEEHAGLLHTAGEIQVLLWKIAVLMTCNHSHIDLGDLGGLKHQGANQNKALYFRPIRCLAFYRVHNQH